MKPWLEIIDLRRTGKLSGEMEEVLFHLCSEIDRDLALPTIKCFNSLVIEGDFSIHLYHMDKPTDKGSKTGFQIAEILKEHGLVNHTLWLEETFN